MDRGVWAGGSQVERPRHNEGESEPKTRTYHHQSLALGPPPGRPSVRTGPTQSYYHKKVKTDTITAVGA